MYLHIGGDHVIDSREIIGVFDIENSTVSSITREYLINNEKEGRVISPINDMPKCFIVIKRENGVLIYLSSLSPATLKKRFDDGSKEALT